MYLNPFVDDSWGDLPRVFPYNPHGDWRPEDQHHRDLHWAQRCRHPLSESRGRYHNKHLSFWFSKTILSLKYYFILMVYALILLFVFFGYALFLFRSNIFHSNQIFVAPIFYSPRELKRNSTTLFWSTPAQRGPSFNRSLCPSPPRRWRALAGSGPLSSVGNRGKRLLTNVFCFSLSVQNKRTFGFIWSTSNNVSLRELKLWRVLFYFISCNTAYFSRKLSKKSY